MACGEDLIMVGPRDLVLDVEIFNLIFMCDCPMEFFRSMTNGEDS